MQWCEPRVDWTEDAKLTHDDVELVEVDPLVVRNPSISTQAELTTRKQTYIELATLGVYGDAVLPARRDRSASAPGAEVSVQHVQRSPHPLPPTDAPIIGVRADVVASSPSRVDPRDLVREPSLVHQVREHGFRQRTSANVAQADEEHALPLSLGHGSRWFLRRGASQQLI